jgi:hypothetical protein
MIPLKHTWIGTGNNYISILSGYLRIGSSDNLEENPTM